MKLLDYFSNLLEREGKPTPSKLDQLDQRVDSITDALKSAENLQGMVLDIVPQGSWAHRTIIRPPWRLEFDADFLVQLVEVPSWAGGPRSYSDAVANALQRHGVYQVMSTVKDRCVRVNYANDCHVDVVPFVVLADGTQKIINRAANQFEGTNPIGFTEWLQAKDDLTDGNLRRALRLLKYLRDHRSLFRVKSVLLTTMVGNIVESWASSEYYQDVPTTLVHLLADLDNFLHERPYKPSIRDPSCPTTTFDHRWDDAQYAAFRANVHELVPRVQNAYDLAGKGESIAGWQEVFGGAFPNGLGLARTAVTRTPVGKTAQSVKRRLGEELIEDKFPVCLAGEVEISCDVDEEVMNRRQRRALRSRHGRVPKARRLTFKIATNVEKPYELLWKVRNHGEEAERANDLRGKLERDGGAGQKEEHSRYAGHHYIECYIIKDKVCVARGREPVIIS